jgi:hypothetical protein
MQATVRVERALLFLRVSKVSLGLHTPDFTWCCVSAAVDITALDKQLPCHS